jgi:diguanylate cyclase (GGDEF)-like protein
MRGLLRERIAYIIFPEGRNERRSLKRLAETDELTGLGNYRALKKALATVDKNTSIIVFDLNNLGQANKANGHERGNWLLRRASHAIKRITKRMTGSTRGFRFGGDEFVVLTDSATADIIRDQIVHLYGSYKMNDGSTVSMTGSVGNTFETADAQLMDLKSLRKQTDLRVV